MEGEKEKERRERSVALFSRVLSMSQDSRISLRKHVQFYLLKDKRIAL